MLYGHSLCAAFVSPHPAVRLSDLRDIVEPLFSTNDGLEDRLVEDPVVLRTYRISLKVMRVLDLRETIWDFLRDCGRTDARLRRPGGPHPPFATRLSGMRRHPSEQLGRFTGGRVVDHDLEVAGGTVLRPYIDGTGSSPAEADLIGLLKPVGGTLSHQQWLVPLRGLQRIPRAPVLQDVVILGPHTVLNLPPSRQQGGDCGARCGVVGGKVDERG